MALAAQPIGPCIVLTRRLPAATLLARRASWLGGRWLVAATIPSNVVEAENAITAGTVVLLDRPARVGLDSVIEIIGGDGGRQFSARNPARRQARERTASADHRGLFRTGQQRRCRVGGHAAGGRGRDSPVGLVPLQSSRGHAGIVVCAVSRRPGAGVRRRRSLIE